ncbi:hypothetical protein Mapa_007462 [Marchantia paleacea]|nr:hypothetical protein Mapa_007462 [Marchantia paleacea]
MQARIHTISSGPRPSQCRMVLSWELFHPWLRCLASALQLQVGLGTQTGTPKLRLQQVEVLKRTEVLRAAAPNPHRQKDQVLKMRVHSKKLTRLPFWIREKL